MPDRCPRCGHSPAGDTACPACGVVFAKLREPRPRSAASSPEPRSGPRLAGALAPWLVVLVIAGGWAGVAAMRRHRRTTVAAVPPPEPAAATAGAPWPVAAAETPPPVALEALPPPSMPTGGLSSEDRVEVERLFAAVRTPQALADRDLESGARLAARYPDEGGLRALAVALFLGGASQDREARRYDRAEARLRRATDADPASIQPWLAMVQVASEAGDWSKAERAARAALALDPRHLDAMRSLAYALVRQDRNREAEEVLQQAMDAGGGDAITAALLARVRKGLSDESGMTERNLSHFHVRYDGDEHEAVGREILRALERHFATLSSTLGHQPAAPIPVILFTRQAYYDASGAPAWSGGVYDNLDGRIRVPVGGLDASLSPDMDETLVHELTHAFVADMTRGVAPREIHEGLAQYMEGKRVERLLDAGQLRLLADGRAGGVGGFYLGALSLVEYLVATRGMGGMAELLREMGATGNVDEAFRAVHRASYGEVRRAWAQRMRQQHGS